MLARFDIGTKQEKTSLMYLNKVTQFCNGPRVFEMSSFQNGTKAVANAVAEATKKGSFPW